MLNPQKIAIPPGDPMWELSATRTMPHNAMLLGMFTHMHLRGRDMTFIAHYPNGQSETLLQIPNFSFNWQLGYETHNHLPAGTKIEAIAHFDDWKPNVL